MRNKSLLIIAAVTLSAVFTNATAKSFTSYKPHALSSAIAANATTTPEPTKTVYVSVNPGYYSQPKLIKTQIKKVWPNSEQIRVTRKNDYTLSIVFVIKSKARSTNKRFNIFEAGREH